MKKPIRNPWYIQNMKMKSCEAIKKLKKLIDEIVAEEIREKYEKMAKDIKKIGGKNV